MDNERIFKPEIQSRQNEITVWVSALFMIGILFFLNGSMFFTLILSFGILMVLFALAISLGNWMDRRTFIMLAPDSVRFENGLRKTSLKWEQVESVSTGLARLGKRVQVSGESEHFTFTVLSDINIRGKVQGRVGFAQGQEIMDEIIKKSNLTSMIVTGDTYYYSRP